MTLRRCHDRDSCRDHRRPCCRRHGPCQSRRCRCRCRVCSRDGSVLLVVVVGIDFVAADVPLSRPGVGSYGGADQDHYPGPLPKTYRLVIPLGTTSMSRFLALAWCSRLLPTHGVPVWDPRLGSSSGKLWCTSIAEQRRPRHGPRFPTELTCTLIHMCNGVSLEDREACTF